MRLGSTPSNF